MNIQVLWDGTSGLSSLSEKTRKSILQMSLQRQRFLLSYLKTLSVGPAGVWTHDLLHGSPMLNQLSQPVYKDPKNCMQIMKEDNNYFPMDVISLMWIHIQYTWQAAWCQIPFDLFIISLVCPFCSTFVLDLWPGRWNTKKQNWPSFWVPLYFSTRASKNWFCSPYGKRDINVCDDTTLLQCIPMPHFCVFLLFFKALEFDGVKIITYLLEENVLNITCQES